MGGRNGENWTPERRARLHLAHAETPADDTANAFWHALGARLNMTGAAAAMACGRCKLLSKVKPKSERRRRAYAKGP
jgi:hypothetical protein